MIDLDEYWIDNVRLLRFRLNAPEYYFIGVENTKRAGRPINGPPGKTIFIKPRKNIHR